MYVPESLVRLVVSGTPAEVWAVQDELERSVGLVLGGRGVVDHVTHHTRRDNTVDTQWLVSKEVL